MPPLAVVGDSDMKNKPNLDELVNRCMIFAYRNGKVLDRGSLSTWLSVEYKSKELSIEFRVQSSPYSNGSSYVKVSQDGKTVLEASGSFTVSAYNMEAKAYIAGDWEKRIPPKGFYK